MSGSLGYDVFQRPAGFKLAELSCLGFYWCWSSMLPELTSQQDIFLAFLLNSTQDAQKRHCCWATICELGYHRGTVTTRCGWDLSSVNVNLISPLLSLLIHYSLCEIGCLLPQSCWSKATIQICAATGTSITAVFRRLKLITIRNHVVTRSYKVWQGATRWGFCHFHDPPVFIQCELSCSSVQLNER